MSPPFTNVWIFRTWFLKVSGNARGLHHSAPANPKPLCWANSVGNVYHGLPKGLSPGDGSGKYLAFRGDYCPEKRVDRAIQIALEVGIPLKIAAKVDRVDREYYECKIKPLLVKYQC